MANERDFRKPACTEGSGVRRDPWPTNCVKPSSCARHSVCMYAMSAEKCSHYAEDITQDIEAAKEQERGRARKQYVPAPDPIAELSTLRSRQAALVEALKPFGWALEQIEELCRASEGDMRGTDRIVIKGREGSTFTVGTYADLIRARAALREVGE